MKRLGWVDVLLLVGFGSVSAGAFFAGPGYGLIASGCCCVMLAFLVEWKKNIAEWQNSKANK